MGYIKGEDRDQGILFPQTIDEYIDEANPVRVVAAFTEALDYRGLGFERGEAAATGRPGYEPQMLMGLYIWGHLNRVRSSRKLEKECERNLEVIWLMKTLRPDFKTIADFRKNNIEAIKQVVVRFRLWCASEGMFGKELVSIDGSKFRASNSRDRNYNETKLKKIIEREREKVEQYLKEMEEADRQESAEGKLSSQQLQEKIEKMKKKLVAHEQLLSCLKESEEKQISLTDEESRLMKTNNEGYEVSFNVQLVVDDKNKLIVDYDASNEGNDKGQLAPMASKGKEALGVAELAVVADAGYYDGEDLKECEQSGIIAYVPEPQSSAKALGVFGAEEFKYDPERDRYVCPQGEELTVRTKERIGGKEYRIYRTNACAACPMKSQCTSSKKGRKLRRWEEQAVIDRLRKRMQQRPNVMKERKRMAEHPFGTIKRAMGHSYFLLRGIKKVTAEIGLTVLAYNIKRAITILGTESIVRSMKKPALQMN